MRIMLDLDGVIREWDQNIFKLFDVEAKTIPTWNFIVDYVCRVKGITVAEFWAAQTADWWANLSMTPEATEILALVDKYDPNYVVVTSPSMTSAGGTQRWIRHNLPDVFYSKRYLIGPAKWACARDDTVLIDDSDKNCEAFRAAGGHAILVPRTWNKNKPYAHATVAHIAKWLDAWEGVLDNAFDRKMFLSNLRDGRYTGVRSYPGVRN